MDIFVQCWIAFTGLTGVWLSQDQRRSWRKWAPVFGLLGQPAWLIATIGAHQWGIMALTFLYAYSWMRGFLNQWVCTDETGENHEA